MFLEEMVGDSVRELFHGSPEVKASCVTMALYFLETQAGSRVDVVKDLNFLADHFCLIDVGFENLDECYESLARSTILLFVNYIVFHFREPPHAR